MSTPRVKIYMSPACPYCRRAIGILEEHGVAYEPVNVLGADEFRDELHELIGRRDVPQVFVDGKHIGDDDHVAEWAEDGRLDGLVV